MARLDLRLQRCHALTSRHANPFSQELSSVAQLPFQQKVRRPYHSPSSHTSPPPLSPSLLTHTPYPHPSHFHSSPTPLTHTPHPPLSPTPLTHPYHLHPSPSPLTHTTHPQVDWLKNQFAALRTPLTHAPLPHPSLSPTGGLAEEPIRGPADTLGGAGRG